MALCERKLFWLGFFSRMLAAPFFVTFTWPTSAVNPVFLFWALRINVVTFSTFGTGRNTRDGKRLKAKNSSENAIALAWEIKYIIEITLFVEC